VKYLLASLAAATIVLGASCAGAYLAINTQVACDSPSCKGRSGDVARRCNDPGCARRSGDVARRCNEPGCKGGSGDQQAG
jgi:hypothetical protein